MSITIIDATPAHAPEIARLIGQLRALEGLCDPIPDTSVQAFLDDPSTDVLLAVRDGDVVGLLSLRVMSDLFHGGTFGLVQELVVDAENRGAGIGGALLDEAIARSLALGCVEMSVTTGEQNVAGQALYRSRGFRSDGVYFERHLERESG